MAVVALVGFALTSCNDDNDSDQGKAEVAELKALLLDEHGQIAFDEAATEGNYQIGLVSLDDARNLTSLYAGKGFAGENYTRTLADGKGEVKVSVGDEGVFYQVFFAVAGIPSFTLNLADGSGGGNSFDIYHKCSVCGFTWMSTINRCPREGNKKYHPQS